MSGIESLSTNLDDRSRLAPARSIFVSGYPLRSALVSDVASAGGGAAIASCFFFIGDKSKESFGKDPTELGGARSV